MRYLRLAELLELHHRIIEQSGGADGIRDLGLAESALAQPQMSFGGVDLYPTLVEKGSGVVFLVGNESSFCGWKLTNQPCRDGDIPHIEWVGIECCDG